MTPVLSDLSMTQTTLFSVVKVPHDPQGYQVSLDKVPDGVPGLSEPLPSSVTCHHGPLRSVPTPGW